MRAIALVLILAMAGNPQVVSPSERLWTDSRCVTGPGTEAIGMLSAAADDGLDPADYDAEGLRAAAEGLCVAPSDATLAAFDERLTAALVRWLHDLHQGRVDPHRLGLRLDVPDDRHDFDAIVRGAARTHRLGELRDEFRPQLGQYAELRAALARYRALVSGRPAIAVSPRRDRLRPGETSADVPAIREQLIAGGDVAIQAVPTGTEDPLVYRPELVEGVRRFQVRHGLTADGVIGPSTWQALAVPLTWRVRQIEFALERMRWLPHLMRRVIAINIPMFELWAWDDPAGPPAFSTPVIVGQALRSRTTPVMARELREVVLRPYWNVPRSILINEIRPLVERDPEYLLAQEMELVEGETDQSPVVPASPANLERLWQGTLRLRQRAGRANALGVVKFVFPNDADVYMHGTPTASLFARDRRDFSHGCVRLQDPVGLATWVLASENDWPRQRIDEAIDPMAPPSRHVRLREPVQVLLLYTTAAALADGRVRFANDIYGQDVRLDRFLRDQRRVRQGSASADGGR